MGEGRATQGGGTPLLHGLEKRLLGVPKPSPGMLSNAWVQS